MDRQEFDIQLTRQGIHLPQHGLWLDARRSQRASEQVFVSHAHADHIAPHANIICTSATSLFMRTRLPGKRNEILLGYGEPRELHHQNEQFQLTLLPAGHICGSAMALIEWRGSSLLYTGDFKLRPNLTAERCAPRQADVLIMETTFGLPHYRFPPEDQVRRDIVKFCCDALNEGATPVLLGYSLGKSQEILAGLAELNAPIMLHPQVRRMTRLHEKLGLSFPDHEQWDLDAARGKVLICPPQSLDTRIRAIGKIRSAIITGWAMDSSCRYQSGTDAAFPLSDHADYDELIEFVRQVNPKKVYTVHGFAREFASTLRAEGFDAVAPGWHEQLELTY